MLHSRRPVSVFKSLISLQLLSVSQGRVDVGLFLLLLDGGLHLREVGLVLRSSVFSQGFLEGSFGGFEVSKFSVAVASSVPGFSNEFEVGPVFSSNLNSFLADLDTLLEVLLLEVNGGQVTVECNFTGI